MNNSIAVHSQTDLINIYNNECNNYSESVNNNDNTILISVIVITYSILNITA